mmetsp:Transcript_32833/g.56134  ORF Transcript_32833/g.56134 Transcript_32833/m.56134 type:complete len:317 (-) Transcript_32833:71-1021(-)
MPNRHRGRPADCHDLRRVHARGAAADNDQQGAAVEGRFPVPGDAHGVPPGDIGALQLHPSPRRRRRAAADPELVLLAPEHPRPRLRVDRRALDWQRVVHVPNGGVHRDTEGLHARRDDDGADPLRAPSAPAHRRAHGPLHLDRHRRLVVRRAEPQPVRAVDHAALRVLRGDEADAHAAHAARPQPPRPRGPLLHGARLHAVARLARRRRRGTPLRRRRVRGAPAHDVAVFRHGGGARLCRQPHLLPRDTAYQRRHAQAARHLTERNGRLCRHRLLPRLGHAAPVRRLLDLALLLRTVQLPAAEGWWPLLKRSTGQG